MDHCMTEIINGMKSGIEMNYMRGSFMTLF